MSKVNSQNPQPNGRIDQKIVDEVGHVVNMRLEMGATAMGQKSGVGSQEKEVRKTDERSFMFINEVNFCGFSYLH